MSPSPPSGSTAVIVVPSVVAHVQSAADLLGALPHAVAGRRRGPCGRRRRTRRRPPRAPVRRRRPTPTHAGRVARECRTTLVSASWTMRKAATSTAAGRRRSLLRQVETEHAQAGRRAGGRARPRAEEPEVVDRRRAQALDDASHVDHGLLDARRAAAGAGHSGEPRGERFWTVSTCRVSPASAGPSPSCRSRRRRRRSCSRASTSRSWAVQESKAGRARPPRSGVARSTSSSRSASRRAVGPRQAGRPARRTP